MPLSQKRRPWLVRNQYKMRFSALALLFIAASLDMFAKNRSLADWGFLGLLMLAYPHIQYWRTCRSGDALKSELSHLVVDAVVVGALVAAIGGSLWIAFAAVLGTLMDNVTNKGWTTLLETCLGFLFGGITWTLWRGFELSLDSSLPATLFCMVGLSAYLVVMSNGWHQRQVQLRQIRENLKKREAQLLTANLTLSTQLEENTQLQLQLERSRQFQVALMEAIPIPIFYKNIQGCYLGFNKAFEDLMGKTRLELMGKSVFDIAPKPLADSYHMRDQDLIAMQGVQVYESQVKDHVGVVHDVIFNKACFFDDTGKVQGLIGGILDITQQKLSERSLRNSEQKLRAIFETANVGISIVDRSGNYQMFNQHWADILGFEIEEMKGLNFQQITHPEDLTLANAKFQDMLDGTLTHYRIEKRYVKKDMSVMWADLSVAAICDSDQQVEFVLGMLVDITERKQAERELIERKQRIQALYTLLRRVADNVPDMIWAKDVNKRYLFANKSVCEQLLLACDTDEPIGKDDLFFAMRARASRPDSPHWHTFGELCQDSDAITLQRGCAAQFDEYGNVKGKLLYLDVHKAPLTGENGELIGVVGSARDVTAERQVQEKLRVAGAVLANSSDALMLSDANNHIVDINPAFTRLTGYTLDEVMGKNPDFLRADKQNEDFFRTLWAQVEATGHWQGEVWNRRKNGEVYAEWLTINTLYHDDGSVHRRVGLSNDITDKKRSEDIIWTQANFDDLTDLPNRRMLSDRLNQALAASKRSHIHGALMFLDLDNFKPLNDRHGHSVGDLLLVEVAKRLSKCVREADTVARFGGDEFVVLLGELHLDRSLATEQARIVAEKIRISLAAPYKLTVVQTEQQDTVVEHHCHASIGVVVFASNEASHDEILRLADAAMYQAKNAGRNVVRFYETPVSAES